MSRCSTRVIPACFAWGFFLVLTAIFFAFPCRYMFMSHGTTGLIITVYQLVLTMIVFCHFLAATCIDPGKYPKAHDHEIERSDPRTTLHRNIDINGASFRLKWCTTCQFYRPPRCSHCSVCDMCIDTFDHHCPWVNNCIGRRNYRYFVLFLLSLWVHIVSVLTFTIWALLKWKEGHPNYLNSDVYIMSIIECCFVCLFLIPVTGLAAFHVFLISTGRTTNEQVTGKISAEFNPFGRGCLQNWAYVFWGPQYPRLMGRHEPKELLKKVKMSKAPGTSIEDVTILIDNNSDNTLEKKQSFLQHSKGDYVMVDDNKSVASSVVSDFKVTQRLIAMERCKDTESKHNLVKEDMTSSLSDYYIADGSDNNSRADSHSETARLISPSSAANSDVGVRVVNGGGAGDGAKVVNGGNESISADNNEDEDESAALLTDSTSGQTDRITTI